jgi:alpha-L-arabinofuranosidase
VRHADGIPHLGAVTVQDALTLSDSDRYATNTQEHPDRVMPQRIEAEVEGSVLRVVLPAASWSCVRLSAVP